MSKIEDKFFPGTELDLYYNGKQIPIIITKADFCSKKAGDIRIYCESKMKNIENFNSIIGEGASFYSNFNEGAVISASNSKGYFLINNKKINCYIEAMNYSYSLPINIVSTTITNSELFSSIQECDINFYISLKEIEEEKNKNIPFTRFEIMDI